MKIIINIPDNYHVGMGAEILIDAVVDGIEIPKEHGRLIDADTIYLIDEDFLYQSDYVVAERAVDNAPTIIEADEG